MPLRITISCCNNLFSEGIKRLLEETNFPQLKKALERVVSGELWFTRKKLKDIVFYMKQAKVEVSQLTKREIEIVKLICNGYRNKEIMKGLSLTDHSVKK